MKCLSFILALFSVTCFADSLPTANPNSVPLFYSLLGNDPKYHDAAFKAQEAFFLQSGFTPLFNKTTSFFTDQANSTATTFIDKDTPLNSKDVFFIAAASYAILVKKQVSKSFKNPVFPFVMQTVTVGQQQSSLGFKVNF